MLCIYQKIRYERYGLHIKHLSPQKSGSTHEGHKNHQDKARNEQLARYASR